MAAYSAVLDCTENPWFINHKLVGFWGLLVVPRSRVWRKKGKSYDSLDERTVCVKAKQA